MWLAITFDVLIRFGASLYYFRKGTWLEKGSKSEEVKIDGKALSTSVSK